MARAARAAKPGHAWRPPLHRIERWWDAATASTRWPEPGPRSARRVAARARDLARLAFCRALMATSNASFGHQSMSFGARKAPTPTDARAAVGDASAIGVRAPSSAAASSRSGRAPRRVLLGDSRAIGRVATGRRYGMVITSPPYANRMSYIRELRPTCTGSATWRRARRRRARLAGHRRHLGCRHQQPRAAGSQPARRAGPASRVCQHDLEASTRESPILGRYVERYFVRHGATTWRASRESSRPAARSTTSSATRSSSTCCCQWSASSRARS